VLRLRICNYQKVGERASVGHIEKVLAPPFWSGNFRNDGIDWSVIWFWREKVRRLGSQAINVCLQTDKRLPISFVISEFKDLVRVKVFD